MQHVDLCQVCTARQVILHSADSFTASYASVHPNLLDLSNARPLMQAPPNTCPAGCCRRLLSTDPEAAKEVVLAEKPVIADTSSNLEPALLDVLLANLSTLSSVYHKPPEVSDVFTTMLHSVCQVP